MIYSFSPFGHEGSAVAVEVDLRKGIPMVDIVGIADGCVAELRGRIRSAITNSGFDFPSERVLISLSPADLRKEGAQFDLAVALAILRESEDMPRSQDEKVMVFGELCLNGELRPCRAVYPALVNAVENGIKYAIVPEQTEALPDGIIVKRVKNLREAFDALCNVDEVEDISNDEELREMKDNGWGKTYNEVNDMRIEFEDFDYKEKFDEIKGCDGLKYAMTVAVAGHHNIMAWGAPGCGKTMTLQCMPLLMPKLMDEERQSVQRIWSIAGLLKPNQKVDVRPFRMPHQTASIEGICGGGARCRPGEISLAHNGVLFLDEAAEFRSLVLQMLRVPLETKSITLSRAGRTTIYPANFQLVMAVNPCPCGNYGSKDKICLCSMKSVEQYWKKFTTPLLDRVAIRVNAENENEEEKGYTLEELRQMIKTAWEGQYERQGKLNQDLSPAEVAEFIKLTDDAKEFLDRKAEGCSPREITNIMKIARTIVDMTHPTQSVIDKMYVKYALELHGKLPIDFQ